MLQEEDAEFRVYLSQLEQHKEDCKDLLKQVANTLDNLSKLGSQYTFVSNKTNSLHEACQQMLDDQTKLSAMADDLENRISYFLEYEKIQSQLSSPTLSVHGDHFRGILNRLDKCISYMQSHVSSTLSILDHKITKCSSPAAVQGIRSPPNKVPRVPEHSIVPSSQLGTAGVGAVRPASKTGSQQQSCQRRSVFLLIKNT